MLRPNDLFSQYNYRLLTVLCFVSQNFAGQPRGGSVLQTQAMHGNTFPLQKLPRQSYMVVMSFPSQKFAKQKCTRQCMRLVLFLLHKFPRMLCSAVPTTLQLGTVTSKDLKRTQCSPIISSSKATKFHEKCPSVSYYRCPNSKNQNQDTQQVLQNRRAVSYKTRDNLHDQIMARINCKITSCQSVYVLSCHLPSKTLSIKVHKTVILLVFCKIENWTLLVREQI
jgi:hypothetical protein